MSVQSKHSSKMPCIPNDIHSHLLNILTLSRFNVFICVSMFKYNTDPPTTMCTKRIVLITVKYWLDWLLLNMTVLCFYYHECNYRQTCAIWRRYLLLPALTLFRKQVWKQHYNATNYIPVKRFTRERKLSCSRMYVVLNVTEQTRIM